MEWQGELLEKLRIDFALEGSVSSSLGNHTSYSPKVLVEKSVLLVSKFSPKISWLNRKLVNLLAQKSEQHH